MQCPNCLKRSKEVSRMNVDLEGEKYVCPRCKHEIGWGGEDDDRKF